MSILPNDITIFIISAALVCGISAQGPPITFTGIPCPSALVDLRAFPRIIQVLGFAKFVSRPLRLFLERSTTKPFD
jgi:hypothetical protein